MKVRFNDSNRTTLDNLHKPTVEKLNKYQFLPSYTEIIDEQKEEPKIPVDPKPPIGVFQVKLTGKTYRKIGDNDNGVLAITKALTMLGCHDRFQQNFDNDVKYAVKKFQGIFNLTKDGIAGPNTVSTMNKVLVQIGPEYSIHWYENSWVHMVRVPIKDNDIDLTIGVKGKLETLQEMLTGDMKFIVNAGFFWTDKNENIPTYYDSDDLDYQKPPRDDMVDFIMCKDGWSFTKNLYNQAEVDHLTTTGRVDWIVGTSYSLLRNFNVDLLNADKFSHATHRNPRTMIGSDRDYFVIAVANGRNKKRSKGLTANQEARFMKDIAKARYAVNADGGYSSYIVVRLTGEFAGIELVLNAPCSPYYRKVGSAITVTPK